MTTVIIIVHVIVCVALIFFVLLQKGKGSEIGAVFGGTSQTVFGSSGAAPFLAKVTAAAAIIFMLTSLGLTFLSHHGGPSVMTGVESQPTPAAPPAQSESGPQQK
ncbi:MAG: preprotein translocase subunit SecG [Deltaproteobacteria bacterium]|nr:preprotein translocase subunit SecG [Deltaproteobacteria bacterium]MBW1952718.1 preprotein translocase subunit SecG [Deltaproteobacteria bacterium]MBW1986351.1 preprotein translocase subunit SecG [Deltaproteobacteria bacterium]MBW2133744.1 preprotein translocase subunit SecG [Deltaproteobacteria bacterium]